MDNRKCYEVEERTLLTSMRVLRETKSVCPECLAVINSIIYERNNIVYLKKQCPKHGLFEDIVYWSDYQLYKWAEQYNWSGTPLENPRTQAAKDCPFNCGLCNKHASHSVLLILDLTSRCELSCEGCFAASDRKPEYVYEPTKEQVRWMLENLQANRPVPPLALQYSGGEPTLRDDLPDLVRMAKEVGFRHVEVNTNGIRLSKDLDYFQQLIDAGMSTIYLQFDSLRPEAIVKLRRVNILPQKLKVIENARKLGFDSIVLVVTLVKGINDQDLGDVIDFAVKNGDVIRCVNVQPVALAGRGRELDRAAVRITIPDFMKLVEKQTHEKIKVTDFRPVTWPIPIARAVGALKGKVYPEFSASPWCGVATFLYLKGDGDYVPITRLVDVDKFAEAMWKISETAKAGHRTLAKMQLLLALRHIKFTLIRKLMWNVLTKGTYEALGKLIRRLLLISCMHFMDAFNMDLTHRLNKCIIHYATPDPEHSIVPFCSYNSYWRPIIERKFGIPYKEWLKRRQA